MKTKKKSESNFLVQGSILAIASIIVRMIGMVYRIPVTRIIGDKGNDYYSTAFEIYNIMLLISSYSIPIAVSKLVSAQNERGRRKNAYRIFKGALIFALISGAIASLMVFFGAEFITNLMKTPMSIFAVKILAPTLLIVAVLGVLRGYFQGLGTMMPSALSQVLEQIVNAIVSILAAYFLFNYGKKVGAILGNIEEYSAAFGAAGSTLGTSIGAMIALLFACSIFFIYKNVLKRQMKREKRTYIDSYSTIFKMLLITIVPVLLSTTIYNISSIVDQGIFKNIVTLQSYDPDTISEWWGVFTGKYKLLTNVPISIASALAASSIPSITAAITNGDLKLVKRKTTSATRFVMVIAFPCAVGMGVLASPIMQLLFNDSSVLAARILQVGTISIILYSLSTISNAILQGIDRMHIPVRNALIALVLHVVALVAMLYLLDLNIYAVVLANVFFALLMCILNGLSIKKHLKYRQEVVKTFIIPGIASIFMGLGVFGMYQFLIVVFKNNAIATIVAIIIGALIYGFMLLLFKGLTEKELKSFPKGYLIIKIAKKLHLL